MTSQIVAKRYARALLEIGQEDGNTEKYGQDLAGMAALMETSPELEAALANPAFDLESRQKLLSVFLEKLGPAHMVQNFFKLLLERGRIGAVQDVNLVYKQLLDEVNGVVRAKVLSAAPLGGDETERLSQALKSVAGVDVHIEVSEDPSLIGGVVAKIGDLVLDGSVKSQLDSLKESLRRGEYA